MKEDEKGERAKQKGNDAFRRTQYAEAVGHYTEAIMANSNNAIYFSNRSMAYMKLNKFEDAERDASAAIRRDSSNVKAIFRRGSARRQMSKWQEAKADFEDVLKLDFHNKEAIDELMYVSERLEEAKHKMAHKPVVLPNGTQNARKANESNSSSLEAARKFLEDVNISISRDRSNQSDHSQRGVKSIPDRFPGESGGFLKEVSTRKLDKAAMSDDFPKSKIALTSYSIPSQKIERHLRTTSKDLQVTPSVVLPQVQRGPKSDYKNTKSRLNAYQFFQELRRCSADLDKKEGVQSQLALLSSLDVSSIPTMLGSLLEPEVLSDLLEILLLARDEMITVAIEMMLILPQCERFETAWMFLDVKEKQTAEQVLQNVRSSGQDTSADVIKAIWRGKLTG